MAEEGVPIASVEQATGIARATLRIWERRYGFPQPGRDPRGERSYPDEQVRKLRLIADLMAKGHRPGRLVQLTTAQLAALTGPAGPRAGGRAGIAAFDDPVLALLRDHDTAGLFRLLEESVRGLGVSGFITERLSQLNVDVGQAWARGQLEVYEEHLYAEAVQGVLRALLAQLQPAAAGDAPRVLLATFPEELHGLGLLMAQVLLALEGCPCTSLGTRVPLQQIVAASRAFRADIVGLSFSASMNPAHVLRGLEQLRGELAPQVAIWAGGSSPVLARHRIAGVRPVAHIRSVPALLAEWRGARAETTA